MKKILLTTLILITALQGFSQKTELDTLIKNCFARSLKVSESGRQVDTILFLSIMDSAFRANPTMEIADKYANYCYRFETPVSFVNSAEKVLKKTEHKDKWYIYVILAHNYKFINEFEKCILTLKEVGKYKEDDKYIMSSALSQSYKVLGNYGDAELVLKRMIEIDSNNYFAYCEYADLLNFMERPDEAIAILNHVQSESFDRSGYGNYGRLELIYGHAYYLKGDYKEAINQLKIQVNKVKNEWMSMYFIAKSYDNLGDSINACVYYKLCVKYYSEKKENDDVGEKFDNTHLGKLQISYYKDAQKRIKKLNCQ